MRALLLQEPSAQIEPTHEAAPDGPEMAPVLARPSSRRSLLKWGGLGAAAALTAAAAAGATGLSQAPTAHASSGDGYYVQLGEINTAQSSTVIGPVSGFSPNPVFAADAVGTTADGIQGSSDSGAGVVGTSNSGVDLYASGTGRLLQSTTSFSGPPTVGTYSAGEQLRDANGDLYICVYAGTPGTWRRVAAGVPGMSGAINFLANPIRLLDTRTGSPYTAGSTHILQVTGVVVGGISVPAGAVGVVGNVTVVGPTSGGDLRLYPGDTAPATSSINFASGQIIANGVTVGLNSGGQLNIKVDMASGTHTNVLFDASGYIL